MIYMGCMVDLQYTASMRHECMQHVYMHTKWYKYADYLGLYIFESDGAVT